MARRLKVDTGQDYNLETPSLRNRIWSPTRRFSVRLVPPKKCINFDICNKQQKWVCCYTVNLTHLGFQSEAFPAIFLHRYLSHVWVESHLSNLSLIASKFSGPPALWSPQTCLVTRTCARCASILRTGLEAPSCAPTFEGSYSCLYQEARDRSNL